MIWHALTTPSPDGGKNFRIDIVDEIHAMALVLNFLLPLGVLAFAVSTGIKIHMKTLQPFSTVIALAGLTGVFACVLAMYGAFVAMHPGVNLWRQIWWRFGT